MRKMTVTGAQVKGFKLSDKGDTGFLTIVSTIYKNKSKRSLWMAVQLKDDLLKSYQAKPIEGGINVEGEFNVSSYTDGNGKLCPRISIKASSIEANDGYGSGLLQVTLTKARLAEDLRITENAAYAKMAQNNDFDDKAMWCDLSFFNNLKVRAESMKLKKGSTCDLTAEFDAVVNSKDDKQYLNILLNVINIYYSALPPKEQQEPAPQQPAAPNPTPAPTQTPTTPAPSAAMPAEQETAIEESELSGEPTENDFF